ncbi:CaiB/BaiF CoA transferase family protein [Novosphingobium guangzhouense]|uniref:Acyl-CoA transferase n=1 Tax=Novosphingobium guangzhouense TaxID=1850347 RepID=A0A2K2G687_9SPHN|nr:CoA transferase [Novosphingobium guangzhouense]PNU06544.1 acyl-CoA transferase [Novosphingobium guangzhouense]
MTTDTPRALAGITVVETAERVSGEYTGKLLADLGAQVIKVERPGGAPTRAMGPFHKGESTLFAYLNANKQSVILDLGDAGERALLDRLLQRAHALVDDHDDGWLQATGLTPENVAEDHPALVHALVTPFGQGAPARLQYMRPINVINAGGWAYHSPSETAPDRPPLKGAGRFLSDYEAGIDAALCTMASILRLRRTGNGQFIDISEVEVQINRIDAVLGRMLAGEAEPSDARTAYDMGGPGASFACVDGHVFLFMTTRLHWKALCTLMGNPPWTVDFREDWLEFDCTPDNVARFRRHFTAWIAQHPKLPTTEAAQKAGVAMVPVNTADDLPRHPQFVERGFFQQAEHPAFGPVEYPGACYRMSATPVRVRTPAPSPGADQQEVSHA